MAKMTVTRNQTIALVATVVVAICLLFSYLTADEGSDDGFRYDESPGDYLAVTIWDEDGECSTHRMALMSDHGDRSLYMVRTFGDIHRMVELDCGFLVHMLYNVPEDAVSEGRETVKTSMGEFECDVLTDSEGNRYWVESHGMVIVSEVYGYTTRVDSTSLAGTGIQDITGSRTDIMAGDYLACKVSNGEGCWVMVYDVDGMDGNGDYVLSVSRIDSGGVDTVERTVGYEELLTMMGFNDDYSAEEYVCDAYFTTSYGTIPCVVYDDDGMQLYVGAYDGLLYYCGNDTVSYEIIGTSLVTDSPLDHYDGILDDVDASTLFMYSNMNVINGLDGYYVESVGSLLIAVTSVDGDRISCDLVSYPENYRGEYIGGVDGLWTTDMPNPMNINSIKVISTPMGNRLCVEYSDIHYMLHFIGLYDSVDYRQEYYSEDVQTTRCLSIMTVTEFTRDNFDPMYGDTCIYDDGMGGKIQAEFYVPGYWIYTDSEWDVGVIPANPGSDKVFETIDTVYGELECSRYTVDGFTIWLYEPLQIPMRVVYDSGDSRETWELEFSNLCESHEI